MGLTTRTCSALALALLWAAPAVARVELARPSGPTTFVGARTAELVGDPRRAALLYAALAAAEPRNQVVANRAISQAIAAGDLNLALQLAARRSPATLPVDARLLLAADRLKRNRPDDAVAILRLRGDGAELDFLAPFVAAWSERRVERSLEQLGRVAPSNAVAAYLPEHQALLLLRARRIAEAEPIIVRSLRSAGGREPRLRLAFADGFMRAGDRSRAAAVLAGREPALDGARRQVAGGRQPGHGVVTPAEAFSELLTALAIDLSRAEVSDLPIAAIQVARHAAPNNPAAPVLLGLLLSDAGRLDDALAVLRSVPAGAPFEAQARDAEARALTRAERLDEALARARAFAASPDATASDWSRLGDVLDAMERPAEAADAFGRAVKLVEAGVAGPELWQLHLLHGAMLEESNRWQQAKAALEAARRLAPQNAMVLNYLGYAQLERGENLDGAEALIAQAHRLAPDDASITDSLGWAQFKRGRREEAIATLQRAAAADPSETEIHEHLGDVLYTVGRKFEARHAWQAALLTAEDDVKQRIEAKIGAGLNPANAAP